MSSDSDGAAEDVLDPEVEDPFDDGVSRRRLLGASAAAGATAAAAGCVGGLSAGGDEGASTVYVFNTGDKTLSVIDAENDELVTTTFLGATASFPSNQYAPELVDSADDALWLNVSSGVKAVNAGSLEEVASFDTGSGANWLELTPDGNHLIVSARKVHMQYRIDADPGSDSFGEVTAELDRSGEADNENGGPGPCDATSGPDGQYAFVPDLWSDTVTTLDVENFEIAGQVDVDPQVEGADSVGPLMGTASWDGNYFTVENVEGEKGTESIWDISDPENPTETHRITSEDGLGTKPLTSEIGPDNEIAYVFTPGTKDVSVIDLASGSVEERLDLGGKAFVGTWDVDREKLYVPVQTTNTVQVIDHAERSIVDSIEVGSKPYGATAGRVRPSTSSSGQFLAAAASVGLTLGETETTYCEASCHCGSMEHATDPWDE